MIFDFMRIILFFDLPVMTRKERKTYALFRKWLLSNGYMMLQYSVYSKIFNNRDSAVKHMSQIRKNAPPSGSVRIMLVTEKQYARMDVIVGGRSRQEVLITVDPVLIL